MFEPALSLYSALGQGIHRVGLTSFAYFPLADINVEEAANIIKKAEEEVKTEVKGGNLRPGVEEQLNLQLSILQDSTVPDCEILALPGLFSMRGKLLWNTMKLLSILTIILS